MKVNLGRLTFDSVVYDEEGDVLYLHMGDPGRAVDFDESPEGHGLRFDQDGSLIGLTILNAGWLLEREGGAKVTVTEHLKIKAEVLERARARALRG